MNNKKVKFGLIGAQLGHSFSKNYFETKYKTDTFIEYQNIEYNSILELKSDFPNLKENYQGLNVTIPYKESVMSLLDGIDGNARKINAVNCIKIQDNKAIGYNTDYTGFVESLKGHISNKHQKALILGSGGASKAVKYALENTFNIKTDIASRKGLILNYEILQEKGLSKYDVIVNSTPLGMFPNTQEFPEIPYHSIERDTLVVDLIYNPYKTIFLQKCQDEGSVIMNGLRMLVLQAKHSYHIWNECE